MGFIRGGETITIKRRSVASTDEHGNPTYSFTTLVVRDALIGIGGTSEPVDPERDAVDASLTLYLPEGTQVEQGDRFIVRGTEWVKDGSAQQWVSPFPMEVGVVVPVRRRVG
jgi:hypothetical protein